MYTYILIDMLTISIPLALSFEKRIYYAGKWKYLFPALSVTAVVFIVWDHFFTIHGIWGFNPQYLLGISIFSLPLEEILFFFCVPFSCVFIYELVCKYGRESFISQNVKSITWGLAGILFVVGIFNFSKIYTSMTFLSLSIFLLVHVLLLKSPYLAKFYGAYVITLLPMLVVNGILTNGIRSVAPGPVVWYDNFYNLGIRMIGIPVEDFMYSMLLLLLNVTIYERLKK